MSLSASALSEHRTLTRLGVCGWPVSHSRSPAMHNAALGALGLHDWRYQRLPAPPELFAQIVRALPQAGFAGANVTVPHKHAALALADSATTAAREIGAANTLSFTPDGAIAAENTDAPGLIAALGRTVAGESALILGAGGTARAAAWALREAGAHVTIWNRTPERARQLASELGVSVSKRPARAALLVNTTTVGMDERMNEDALTSLGLQSDDLRSYAQVVDFVYASRPTPLLTAARAHKIPTVDGLAILVAQGALSLERWSGRAAPLDVMRAAAEGDTDG